MKNLGTLFMMTLFVVGVCLAIGAVLWIVMTAINVLLIHFNLPPFGILETVITLFLVQGVAYLIKGA